ncbi:HlyD family efflux transporter periplasmic adaptor subunit [Eoetvoesiella caeni]
MALPDFSPDMLGTAMAPPLAASQPEDAPLPALREDLVLFAAGDNRDGSPAWMIQDPVSNRFYRIGWLEFEMLSRWQKSGAELLNQLRRETPLLAGPETLKGLLGFLEQNYLLRANTPEASDRLAAQAESRKRRDLKWLLHHYLFIRIPLVRPDRFLAAMLPYVSFIYTRLFALVVVGVAIVGLFLASRQWDAFVVSFQDSFTPAGILAYMVALAFAKVLHEMGHALTATRYGCRVAHMGVSLIVMFPMLYTDTSESWKLTDPRKRLAIVVAGMATEAGIAAFATLFWSLTDDGVLRSAFFFLATTSWILSLGINASPFMRFDGYFVLSDVLDLPNLHTRSFAFGRHFLRRRLLGWRDPLPEPMPRRVARFLTVFAFIVWIVRFTVFLGIAIGVYLYFFKALGIFLFAVEIAWFIVMPVWSELKVWWRRRRDIGVRHRLVTAGIVLVVLCFLLVPWSHGVHAPGWIRAQTSQLVFAPYPARVAQVREAGPVKAGDVLLVLESPDVQARQLQAQAASATVWSQIRRANVMGDGVESRELLGSRLKQEQAEVFGAKEESERLELTAPFSGKLTGLDPLVQPGVWVSTKDELGVLVDDGKWIAEAFVDPGGLRYLQRGDLARVHVADQFAPLKAVVIEIDTARTQTLPSPMLDAAHGGSIRVSTVNNRQEVQHALYRVRLELEERPESLSSQLANVVISGQSYSIAAEWFRKLAGAIIRESDF